MYDQEAQWEQTDEMYRQLQAVVVEAVAHQGLHEVEAEVYRLCWPWDNYCCANS